MACLSMKAEPGAAQTACTHNLSCQRMTGQVLGLVPCLYWASASSPSCPVHFHLVLPSPSATWEFHRIVAEPYCAMTRKRLQSNCLAPQHTRAGQGSLTLLECPLSHPQAHFAHGMLEAQDYERQLMDLSSAYL